MKNAKTIGVDFDDVIVSTNHAVALWHNRVYGTSYELKDVLSWELATLWGCTKEESYLRMRGFFDSDEHFATMPIPAAVESLKLLSNKELQIVTARPPDFHSAHMRLARQHVPFLLDRFNFINLVVGQGIVCRKKSEVCLELGVEVFIEDHLEYAFDVASVGIPVLLFDCPWNQKDNLPLNVTRVYSWEEILQKLV